MKKVIVVALAVIGLIFLGGNVYAGLNEGNCQKITHTSPSSTTNETEPTFTWEEDTASTWYKFWMGSPSGDKVFAQWYDATKVCSGGNCSVTLSQELTSGNFEWYIKSWNDSSKVWSDGMAFTVQTDETAPSKTNLISPSGQIQNQKPTFTWAEDTASTYYKLWVGYNGTDKAFAKWYEAAEICFDGTCSVTPESELTVGDYGWYIKSWNENGKMWSDGMAFIVSMAYECNSEYLELCDNREACSGAYGYWYDDQCSTQKSWSQTFGTSIGHEYGRSVQETSDGGYILVGTSGSFDIFTDDVYLIKTNSSGDETWARNFGCLNHFDKEVDDYGYSVQETSDGGYIIAGETDNYFDGADVYLIKTDSNGNETWSKKIGGTNDDYSRSLQETADGGYIIAGTTKSFGAGNEDVYLIKTNSSGHETWSRTFGGTNRDYGYSVQQTVDGGYIITGKTQSFGAGKSDVYLIKTDSSGNETWSKTFGGTLRETGNSVHETSDGGYIIAGDTYSFGAGNYDVYLIKTDSSGTETWSRTFGGTKSETGYSAHETSDGGYTIVGKTQSFGAGGSYDYTNYDGIYYFYDVFLVKTDSSGNVNNQ